MIRNGTTTPFPNMFARPPAWRIQTSRGNRGSRLRRYARIEPERIPANPTAHSVATFAG
jgi:hypothetical protein